MYANGLAPDTAIHGTDESLYHALIDLTYDWEYLQGEDGTFLYSSPSGERITGYRPDEFRADPALLENILLPGTSWLPHLTNILLHVLNVCLLWQVTRFMLSPKGKGET